MSRLAGVAMVAVLAVGCGGNSLKLGSDDDAGVVGTGGSGPTGVPDCSNSNNSVTVSENAAPNACVTGNEQSALVGKWDGYYQGAGLSDEYSTFHLNIMGANAEKGLCGTIMFGTQTVPITIPPATDPTADYPPAALNLGTSLIQYSNLPTPGFLYTILGGRIDGQRVRFGFVTEEIFNSWCELQTPYADADCTSYACLPNWGLRIAGDYEACYMTDPTTNQEHQYSCAQVSGCTMAWYPVCQCDKTHCVSNQNTNSFDLEFKGDQATGIRAARDGAPIDYNVILNRVQ